MFDKLTAKDIQRMQEEIEHRKLVIRPQALEDVKEARSHGDLSENFEYYAAKKFKNQNESRIRYLEKMIKTAQIISDESAEAAPVYHIGEAESYAPMMILVATNDMQNRYEQTLLLVSTMKHFGYDMEKVDFRLLEGRHCIYDNFKLQELVTEFIEKTI